MTQPDQDPNQQPFAKQVHQSRASGTIAGLDQNTQAGLRGKFIESILQLITQAITGAFIPGGGLGSAFSQLSAWAGGLIGNVTGVVTDLGNIVNGVIGGVASGISGAIGGFINSLLGIGGAAIPAYSPSNAAISALQGQVNALRADNNPSTDGAYDGFNTGPNIGSKWAVICGGGTPVTADGIVFAPANFECYRYDDIRPGTTFWQVQASLAFVPGVAVGATRIFGGADATLSTRFPAIEYAPIGAGNIALRIVSLAGTPNTSANRNLGRMVHAEGVRNLFSFKTGDVLALECDEDNAIYNVYFNPGPGTPPILSYNDSVPNLIPRGAGHRDGGFQLNLEDNTSFPGNGWDNFALFDRET